MGRYQHRHKGFTLIELLIALLIFALLSVMAYTGLNSVISARNSIERNNVALAQAQTFFIIMARDIEQIASRPIRGHYGDRLPSLSGGATQIEFSKNGWRNPANLPRSHIQRISYRLDEDQLTRYGWRVLDRAQDSEAHAMLSLDKVKQFELRYLDHTNQWQSQWPPATQEENAASLPLAIEIHIDLESLGRITRLYRVAGKKIEAETT